MWKEIYEWATQLLILSKETERNRTDIKDLREEKTYAKKWSV